MFSAVLACGWFKFFITLSETSAKIVSEGTNTCASSFFFVINYFRTRFVFLFFPDKQ